VTLPLMILLAALVFVTISPSTQAGNPVVAQLGAVDRSPS
jgi:hypothetical protein